MVTAYSVYFVHASACEIVTGFFDYYAISFQICANFYSILWVTQNECFKNKASNLKKKTSHFSQHDSEIMTSARVSSFPQLWSWIRYYKIWLHATGWNGGSKLPSRNDNFHQTIRRAIPKDCIILPFLFPQTPRFLIIPVLLLLQ